MSWCWFALLDAAVGGEVALAAAREPGGATAGWFAAWPAGRKPVATAVRMDAGALDPHGAPAAASLLVLPRDRSPIFDDPAVSGALRAVLAGPRPDAVSTFVRDSSHFAGAVTARRADRERLRDDPFTRLGPARLLEVDAGFFATGQRLPEPVIQRYGGQPWPASGFAT